MTEGPGTLKPASSGTPFLAVNERHELAPEHLDQPLRFEAQFLEGLVELTQDAAERIAAAEDTLRVDNRGAWWTSKSGASRSTSYSPVRLNSSSWTGAHRSSPGHLRCSVSSDDVYHSPLVTVASPRAAALPRSFFARSVHDVAQDLIGCTVAHGTTAGVIVETESYHVDDPACHAFGGPTPRSSVLFGPPAHVYVYLSYGIHTCSISSASPRERRPPS